MEHNISRLNKPTGSVPPYISRELADWLNKQYPEMIPEANQSRDAIMKYAGKRELVLRLKELAYAGN